MLFSTKLSALTICPIKDYVFSPCRFARLLLLAGYVPGRRSFARSWDGFEPEALRAGSRARMLYYEIGNYIWQKPLFSEARINSNTVWAYEMIHSMLDLFASLTRLDIL
jgi:hypothetical protein